MTKAIPEGAMKMLVGYCRAHDATAWYRGDRLYAIETGTRREYEGGPSRPYARIVELTPTFSAVRIWLGY